MLIEQKFIYFDFMFFYFFNSKGRIYKYNNIYLLLGMGYKCNYYGNCIFNIFILFLFIF